MWVGWKEIPAIWTVGRFHIFNVIIVLRNSWIDFVKKAVNGRSWIMTRFELRVPW